MPVSRARSLAGCVREQVVHRQLGAWASHPNHPCGARSGAAAGPGGCAATPPPPGEQLQDSAGCTGTDVTPIRQGEIQSVPREDGEAAVLPPTLLQQRGKQVSAFPALGRWWFMKGKISSSPSLPTQSSHADLSREPWLCAAAHLLVHRPGFCIQPVLPRGKRLSCSSSR